MVSFRYKRALSVAQQVLNEDSSLSLSPEFLLQFSRALSQKLSLSFTERPAGTEEEKRKAAYEGFVEVYSQLKVGLDVVFNEDDLVAPDSPQALDKLVDTLLYLSTKLDILAPKFDTKEKDQAEVSRDLPVEVQPAIDNSVVEELNSLQAKLSENLEQLSQKDIQLNDLLLKYHSLEETLLSKNSQFTQLEEKVETLSKNSLALAEAVKEREHQLSSLTQQSKNSTDHLSAEFNAKLSASKSEFESLSASLRASLLEKETLINSLQTSIKEKQFEHEKLEQSLQNEKSLREKAEKQVSSLRQQLLLLQSSSGDPAGTERSIENGDEGISSIAKKKKLREELLLLEEAEKALLKHRESLDASKLSFAELDKQFSLLNQAKQEFSTQKVQLEEQIKALEAQLQSIKASSEELFASSQNFRNLILQEQNLIKETNTLIQKEQRARQLASQPVQGAETSSGPRPGSFELIPWENLELGKQIGTGAFAEVFEASRAGERVAVKKFLAQSEEGRKEMEAEIAVMVNLHSGYVVSLYGACLTSPNLCIVMEFMARGSLFYLLSDSSVELPWERRLSMAKDAALGINYLHSKKPSILHRDMKSGNLLVGADWKVKVCDFGQSEESTKTTKTAKERGVEEGPGGTARWTAPEVLSGELYTEAADIYSYGIILWEIATRKIPFEDVPSYNLANLVTSGTRPPEPSDDVPSDYLDLMKNCWHRSPNQRPSASQIVRSFEQSTGKNKQIAGDDPISQLENLQRDHDELKSTKEKLEREWELLEKRTEREKEQRVEYERQKEEIDRKLDQEKRRAQEVERQFDTTEKRVALEKQTATENEKKRKKDQKKLDEKRKRQEDKLLEEKETVEKKLEMEKSKNEKIKRQLDDAESLLESERARKVEVERQRDEAERKARAAASSGRKTSSFYNY